MNEQVVLVPTDKIQVLEKLNPRKRRDKVADAQLLQSIKHRFETLGGENAIIEPLTVTERGSKPGDPPTIILANGERRLQAAKECGLRQVPVLVRVMDNETIYELRLLESLQHNELHPLDESDAYAELSKVRIDPATKAVGPRTITQIAQQFSKDEAHVARRLKLQEISPEVRKAFEAGTISVDHAEVLAIYPVKIQNAALTQFLLPTAYRTGYDEKDAIVARPVAQLKEWLRQNGMLNLGEASFSKTDATLNPKMGACTTCPYKTESQQTLFGDLPGGFCLVAECYNTKRKAFAKSELRKAQEKYKGVTPILISSKPYVGRKGVLDTLHYDRCEEKDKGAVLGQLVDGKQEGKVVWIKVKKFRDEEHTTAAKEPSAKEKAKIAAAERVRRFAYFFDDVLFGALIEKCPKELKSREDLYEVAELLGSNFGLREAADKALKIKSLPEATPKQLVGFIILCTLSERGGFVDGLLETTAKRWKVDVKKLKSAARKEFEKAEKAEPEKKAA